jgi:NAD(P)-dependent dehydrogenase (short-subunit alcohol dehydrogenase family)
MVRVGDMAGRVALITGGSRGIGLAAATALHDAGASVVLTARGQEALEDAVLELGSGAAGFAADAADPTGAADCVAFAIERFGRLDVLVNNAGANPYFGPLADIDDRSFAKAIELNVHAPLVWTKHAVSAWMGEHGGSVINMASIAGFGTGRGFGIYNVTKAALMHLTRQLAIELAPSVRVNALAPGIVRTEMARPLWQRQEQDVAAATPLRRVGEPRDVGEAVRFLASDAASWITGETLVVDGGQIQAPPAAITATGLVAA